METLEFISFGITAIALIYIFSQKESLKRSDFPIWAKTIFTIMSLMAIFYLVVKYTPLKEFLYYPIFDHLIFPITAVIFSIQAFILFKQKKSKSSG